MPNLDISAPSLVQSVVRSAYLRFLLVLAVEQTGFTLASVCAGAILILLLGTQILNWYWLTLLAVLAILVSIVRLRAGILTRYRIAQLLDDRLALSDALSTAWFLLSRPASANDSLARFQIEGAEQLASAIEPAHAFPFRRNRVWLLTGALTAALIALFALRYLVQSRLDFEQSLIPVHPVAALEALESSLSAETHVTGYPELAEQARSTRTESQPQENDARDGMTPSPETGSGQDVAAPDGNPAADHKTASQDDGKPQQAGSGKPESSETSEQNNRSAAAKESFEPANTPTPNLKQKAADNQQATSNLFEKMKDAASSLLAKMRSGSSSQTPTQKGEQSSDSEKRDQSAAANTAQRNQPAAARNQQTRPDSGSAGNQQAQTTEKTEPSAGQNPDNSTEKNGSDAHSGIGRRDGEKAIKDAEQLQAMGKLAEIIGKRSANLTGEITVETSSGKQELATRYSHRVGRHSDLGGEINRDEIPLSEQQYVREYIQRVHEQANIHAPQ